MGNLLYLIAVILVIAWAIGFLGYHASGLIHILLVIAVIVVLLRIIRGAAWLFETEIEPILFILNLYLWKAVN